MHFGLGWGALDGTSDFRNPFAMLSDRFNERPGILNIEGGKIASDSLFSGKNVSPFYGISYAIHPKVLLKVERDSTLTDRYDIPYDDPKSRISFGFDYLYNDNINIGLSAERGNHISLRFTIKQGLEAKQYKYVAAKRIENESKETSFIRNLQANGLGINEIFEDSDTVGVEVMQFSHPSLDIIEEIIMTAKGESGINKDIKVNYTIHGLNAEDQFDQAFKNRSKQSIKFVPFIGSPPIPIQVDCPKPFSVVLATASYVRVPDLDTIPTVPLL